MFSLVPHFSRIWDRFLHFVNTPAKEYDELQRLRALERRAYRLGNLPARIADAIETSTMNPARNHLDDLLKE